MYVLNLTPLLSFGHLPPPGGRGHRAKAVVVIAVSKCRSYQAPEKTFSRLIFQMVARTLRPPRAKAVVVIKQKPVIPRGCQEAFIALCV